MRTEEELKEHIIALRKEWKKDFKRDLKRHFGNQIDSMSEPIKKALNKMQKVLMEDYLKKCEDNFLQQEEALSELRKKHIKN